MNMQVKIKSAVAIIAGVICIATGIYFTKTGTLTLGTSAAKSEKREHDPFPPGTVSFPAHGVQLASIRVMTARRVPLPVSEPLFGRIAYDENRTTRISSPVTGRVTKLKVELGDKVAKFDTLAELDAPDLATAQADLQKARADESRKTRAFARARLLFDGQVMAAKDYESAQADVEQASAETRRAAQRLKNLHATGGQDGIFWLRAPLAGTVSERQVNPGQEVRPDLANPLFVITDLDYLWAIVDVPEQVAAGIHEGTRVSVTSDAWPDEHFAVTVEKVAPVLDPTTRRVQVRCAVRNVSRKLKPEMFAKVSFLSDATNQQAIALPNTSLYVDGLASFVFVQTAPGTFVKRRVSIARSSGDITFITDGIADGERVVVEGAFLLNAEVKGNVQ